MAYTHLNTKNPRGKKLNAIMQKIAMYMVQETYQDEPEVHELLGQAIQKLEEAADKCINNDKAAESNAQAGGA